METLLDSSSPFFDVLWPTIIKRSPFRFRRRSLRNVNHYFRRLCDKHKRSDRAKESYLDQKPRIFVDGVPPASWLDRTLDSADSDWRIWESKKGGFLGTGFADFCALGDIDVSAGHCLTEFGQYLFPTGTYNTYTWVSREGDLVVRCKNDPRVHCDGSAYFLRVIGRASKAIAMYNFFHDRHIESIQPGEIGSSYSYWEELYWSEGYAF